VGGDEPVRNGSCVSRRRRSERLLGG